MVISHTVSEVVRDQRQYLGLRLTDLESVTSLTTISRFESGKTQISFGKLGQLCSELCILPSQVLVKIRQSTTDPIGTQTLYSAINQIERIGKDSIEVEAIIQHYIDQFSDFPTGITDTQLFVLRNRVGMGGKYRADMVQNAPRILSRLLQMNRWAGMEMCAVAELVDWLAPEQLSLLFQHGRRVTKAGQQEVGFNFFYEALNKAIQRVIAHYPRDIAADFLNELSWLSTRTSAVPAKWQAVGSWYIANYIIDPNSQNLEAIITYMEQTKCIGHPDTLDDLNRFWADKLPTGMLDSFLL